ncbi:phenylalanine--tRNA ligase beta subunit [Abditibacteriota bacterium]|nr:phenylalanine--tRNA ligase beta subunit [Abditibacteriota bacterium]
MRISAEWLGEYVQLPPIDKLENILLLAGLGVDERDGDRFELEVTSNRGDWLCATGLAREIGAMTEARYRAPAPHVDEDGPSIRGRVEVSIFDPEDCARYCARLVEGVKIGPSPEWIQKRLLDCGVRPINNVVDATNYVMLEWGQPLHAFDFDRLGGRIVVRRAGEGETLKTLDGQERTLSSQILVIADAEKPVAIAGIMGGADSEVSDSTVNVLLESAHFSPTRVRRGVQSLGLASEASRRFERWVDPNGCKRSLDRAAQLLASIAGGKVATDAVDVYPRPATERVVSMRPARANEVLGLNIETAWMQNALDRLGFKTTLEAGSIVARVPTRRRDIEREIDLIEEVARLWGYDRVPTTLSKGVNVAAGRPLAGRLEDRARSACLRCGLTEVATISLSNETAHTNAGLSTERAVKLRNALTEDYTLLRTSLLPSLLDVLARNKGRRLRGFEIGRVYETNPTHPLADEKRTLGVCLSDAPAPAHWQKTAPPADFFALKAIVGNVLREFGAPEPVFEPSRHLAFHPGRCASVSLNGAEVGVMGEIHPLVAAKWEIPHRVYIAQIDFDALVRHISLVRQFKAFSNFPAVERDFAFVVPQNLPSLRLVEAVQSAGGDLVTSARVVDVFQGANLGEGMKSLALSLRLQAADRTLGENDIEGVSKRVIEAAGALGASIRS